MYHNEVEKGHENSPCEYPVPNSRPPIFFDPPEMFIVRNSHKCLKEFVLHGGGAAAHLQFSDRKMLGACVGGDSVEFYKDVCVKNLCEIILIKCGCLEVVVQIKCG